MQFFHTPAQECYNKTVSKITKYLNQLITGNVFDTPEICEAYSTDRSILKVIPKLVAFPESTEDLRRLMKFFNQLTVKNIRVPVVIRGSGLDETGSDLSSGIVVSTEKLNHLMEIDTRERLVRVQSGITLKELNTALSVCGLTIPVGASENETIGSLISNCPTDPYSSKYGGIMNFVERAEIILPNGECIQTGRLGMHSLIKKFNEGTLEGKIYQSLLDIVKDNTETIEKIKKQTTSVGYQPLVYAVRKDSIDLLPLLFSAQGTLGIISEVILHAEVLPPRPVRFVATLPDFKSTYTVMKFINELKPREVNFYDLRIIRTAEAYGKDLSKIIKKSEEGYVVYASFDEKGNKAQKKLKQCADFLKNSSKILIEDDDNRKIFDELENSLISYLNLSPEKECLPLITDFYIPSERLADFIDELHVLEDKLKTDFPLYGSFSTSNYHVRPEFNLELKNERKKAVLFLKTGALLIHRQNGALASGSPDGRVKALVTNEEISKEEKALYKEIKNLFDPNNILNPGIKVFADPRFTINHIRDHRLPKINL